MTKLLAQLLGRIGRASDRQSTASDAIHQVLQQTSADLSATARFQRGWLHVELEEPRCPEVHIDMLLLEDDVLHHAVGMFQQGKRTSWRSGLDVPYFGMSLPYAAGAGAPMSWTKPLQEGHRLITPVLYRKDTSGRPYATEFSHRLVFTAGRLRAVPSESPPRLRGRRDFSRLTFSVVPGPGEEHG